MDGSRTIRVRKRDGSVEAFEARKLAASLLRVVGQAGENSYYVRQIAEAVKIYLLRRRWVCISSAAIFEMSVSALRSIGRSLAADAMEWHQLWRNTRRGRIRVRHDDRKETLWEKGWLCKLAVKCWFIRPTTARILVGQIEQQLISEGVRRVSRDELLEMLNNLMMAYGLADAVPVGQ
ncbi:MAG: hypothetical protein SVT52_01290 [Planctomycetota bacterium]|nr:hypothetical protein [Planctomycetota bacterium]